MIELLKSWVLNIVILAVFVITLEILAPSGKIKKFIHLVSGFILVIALINPFLKILAKGVDLKELEVANSNMLQRKEIISSSDILEERQMKQIVEVYRKKIVKQLEQSTKEVKGISSVSADVVINEDYKSDTFGEIRKAYIYLMVGEEKTGIKPVTKIEKVEINMDEKRKIEKKEVDGEIRREIENKLNQALAIKKDNIVIVLQQR